MVITSEYLALTDSEHLGAAYRTCSLGRRPAVLHGDTSGILYLPLSSALNTISLHIQTSFGSFAMTLSYSTSSSQDLSRIKKEEKQEVHPLGWT
jgi:hypothetical protein